MQCSYSRTFAFLSILLAANVGALSSSQGPPVLDSTSTTLLPSSSSSSTSSLRPISDGLFLTTIASFPTTSAFPSVPPPVSPSAFLHLSSFPTSSGAATFSLASSSSLYRFPTTSSVVYVSTKPTLTTSHVSRGSTFAAVLVSALRPHSANASKITTVPSRSATRATSTSIPMSTGALDPRPGNVALGLGPILSTLRPSTTRDRGAPPRATRPPSPLRPGSTGRPRVGESKRPPLAALISSLRSAVSSASAARNATATQKSSSTRTANTRSFGPFVNNTTTTQRPTFPTTTLPSTLSTLTMTSRSPTLTPDPTLSIPPSSPTSLPAPIAQSSTSLPPATIGGITAGAAASLGIVLLLAFLLYRKRQDRLRPSYLEASEGGSTTLLSSPPPIMPLAPLLTVHPALRNTPTSPVHDSPVSPLSPMSSMPIISDARPYINPYYAALAQRNPSIFAQRPPTPVRTREEKRKRRRSLFLLRGWERTRLSGIPEGLEGESEDEDRGEWRRTVSEGLGGFRFWESREDVGRWDEDEDEGWKEDRGRGRGEGEGERFVDVDL
ncbi:hypothetical protein BDZ85DRAFT_315033 [Elsinoe ampelina]|uniref:Uncharacterized protein n=1 Tax=Elsinoe ampelina TaxID=302913 RepID=A0A6A6GNX6_9PEZI|nr:hypothetical protein BDZ85DRAFT_315033 [Elsinoe ampelina]